MKNSFSAISIDKQRAGFNKRRPRFLAFVLADEIIRVQLMWDRVPGTALTPACAQEYSIFLCT